MADSAPQRRTDFISQIMEFRTAYLKAVARATVDLDFRQRLTLTGTYSGGTVEALHVMKSEFNYECPWDMRLKLIDSPKEGPRVNTASGTIMTRPYRGETITIYIPPRPDLRNYHEQERPVVLMGALAAYYHENQYFLSTKLEPPPATPAAPDPGARDSDSRRAERPPPLDDDSPDYLRVEAFRRLAFQSAVSLTRSDLGGPEWSSVDVNRSPTPRFNLGTCLDDFISFAAAMFNAVAMSWENERFRQMLITPDDEPAPTPEADGEPFPDDGTSKQRPRKHTITILNQWLGYRYPWELELVVKLDEQAEYSASTGKWINRRAPELMLTLPWMTGTTSAEEETTINANNPGVAIMGLALYNTDGPGYPFTCG